MCPGRRGLYTGSSGLTVAYLSGIETSVGSGSREADTDDTHFTAINVDDLRQSLTGVGHFHGVDLLLTSQWPRAVDKYATAAVSHHHPKKVKKSITSSFFNRITFHLAVRCRTFWKINL